MQQMQRSTRFILVSLVSPRTRKHETLVELDELKQLVSTFGGATIVRVIQRKDTPDKNSYIGKGKTFEIAEMVEQDNIDVVVINAIVKPTQLFEIQKILQNNNQNIAVWDRIDLILQIFRKHAHTREAKLQIDLAAMRHMGPRIFGLGYELSRQGGGIGTRGIGETNIERMRRHWRREMKKAQDELAELVEERKRQIAKRKERGFKTISIVGYTNAGKSTLFNVLTGKQKLAQNVLFATLDSAVGKLYLPKLRQEVLVSDTIGFIQSLPPSLIEAFKSTLMESIEADVLLHVIDASDPRMEEKIHVVHDILEDLGISGKPQLYVFNKIDKESPLTKAQVYDLMHQYEDFNPQFISAKTNEGIAELKQAIERESETNTENFYDPSTAKAFSA